jgi:hypothetical protein
MLSDESVWGDGYFQINMGPQLAAKMMKMNNVYSSVRSEMCR